MTYFSQNVRGIKIRKKVLYFSPHMVKLTANTKLWDTWVNIKDGKDSYGDRQQTACESPSMEVCSLGKQAAECSWRKWGQLQQVWLDTWWARHSIVGEIWIGRHFRVMPEQSTVVWAQGHPPALLNGQYIFVGNKLLWYIWGGRCKIIVQTKIFSRI